MLAEHVGGRPGSEASLELLATAVTAAVEAAAMWWQSNPGVTAEALAELLAGLLAPGLIAVLAGQRDPPPRARRRRR